MATTSLKVQPESEESRYYKQFAKLLKNQMEPPFLYTSLQNFDEHSVDLSVLKRFSKTIIAKHKFALKSLFEQLGVTHHHKSLLRENGIEEPLPVQKAALPDLFARKSAIIESETGSGKTLTYLLPILQNLGNRSCSNIIIVPTRELASQVYHEVLKYIPDRRLVVRYVSGIDQERKLDRALRESHVIVATPKRLAEIFEQKSGHFRNVQRIVLDEVDKLLPVQSFRKENINKVRPAEKLLTMLLYQNKRAQLIATSATVSNFLIQELQDRGFTNKCRVIKCCPEGYINGKVPDNIQHFFMVAEPADDINRNFFNKVTSIARLFRQSGERSALVFVPRDMSVQSVVSMFQEMQFTTVALYKKILLPKSGEFERFSQAFEKGDIEIVVSSEETVRGMDFPFVNQAYLTYIPSKPEDYVHVAGRVGRANRPGNVTTILNGSDEHGERKRLKRRLQKLRVKSKRLVF